MNINSFATNEKLELSGIWKELGGGAAILVARSGNPEYNKKIRKEMEPYTGPAGLIEMSDAKAKEIFITAEVGTVLLDWRGLTDEVGSVTEYSEEVAIEWMMKYKEFRKIITAVAENIDNYKTGVELKVKEDIKKS